jgi:hypothetical protein
MPSMLNEITEVFSLLYQIFSNLQFLTSVWFHSLTIQFLFLNIFKANFVHNRRQFQNDSTSNIRSGFKFMRQSSISSFLKDTSLIISPPPGKQVAYLAKILFHIKFHARWTIFYVLKT